MPASEIIEFSRKKNSICSQSWELHNAFYLQKSALGGKDTILVIEGMLILNGFISNFSLQGVFLWNPFIF